MNAQFAERIGSAQPGNTPGAGTVGKRMLQFQQGYTLLNMRLEASEDITNSTPPSAYYGYTQQVQNNTIRYGLFERFELRGRVSYRKTNSLFYGSEPTVSPNPEESLDFDLGFRVNLVHKPKIGFDLALQSDLGPTYNDLEVRDSYLKFNSFLLASQRFAKNFVFTLNTGFGAYELGDDELIVRGSIRYFCKDWLFHVGYSRNQRISNASNLNLYSNGYFFAIAYHLNNELLLNVDFQHLQVQNGQFFLADGNINGEQFYNVGVGVSWRINFRN